ANDIALGLGHGFATLEDHSLGEEARGRLAMLDQTNITHELAPEEGIKEVQNRVRNSADVLVDWEPVANLAGIEKGGVLFRIAVTVEVPGGIDERVHRVGLAARQAAALGAPHIDEAGIGRQWRFAFTGQFRICWQNYGQILIGDWHHAVLLTINDRDRR